MANGIRKKQQLDEQRRKRTAAAVGLAKGAKSPARPIPCRAGQEGRQWAAQQRRTEPLPPAHYPTKRAAIGKRQGGAG
jgi:hypothetical protein